jgi:hypothetical protein
MGSVVMKPRFSEKAGSEGKKNVSTNYITNERIDFVKQLVSEQ